MFLYVYVCVCVNGDLLLTQAWSSLKREECLFFVVFFYISELLADSYLLITELDDTEQQPGFQLPLPTSELTARMQN